MSRFNFGYLAVITSFSLVSASPTWGQSQTTTVETYEAPVDSYSVPVQRLDSWMAPAHVRTREVVKADGEREIIQEPLVLERHERVLAPVSTTRSIMETQYGGRQVTTAQTTASSVRRTTAPRRASARRHSLKRRAVAARPSASKSRIAWRTVSTPVVIERREETEHRAVILERKDPALLVY